MIKIAICDDEPIFISMMKEKVMRIMQDKNMNCEIAEYTSPIALLGSEDSYDAVFLDMDMPDMDGVEAAKRIHRTQPQCHIYMATGRDDRFKETYSVAEYFISKPYADEEIAYAIDLLIDSQIGMKEIELFRDRVQYKILQRDITYIVPYDGYLQIYANGVAYRKKTSLLQIMEELDSRMFYKIRKDMAVNMLYIDKYEKNKIYIADKVVEVARANRKDFEMVYRKFDLTYRG